MSNLGYVRSINHILYCIVGSGGRGGPDVLGDPPGAWYRYGTCAVSRDAYTTPGHIMLWGLLLLQLRVPVHVPRMEKEQPHR
jgi:hypothetical protein